MVYRLEFLSKILNYFCPLCEEMPAKPKNHWRDIAMIDSIYTIISYNQGRQTGLKSVGADETFRDFLRLQDFEARSLYYVRDFETTKSMGASAPPAPTSLGPC